ncbi:elastase-1-like [Hoplias malabaricus]|uniref:elastase-1-like n=1 Tax=Hoplias malabaricus TaxID=27720 RepID=UPI0034634A6E
MQGVSWMKIFFQSKMTSFVFLLSCIGLIHATAVPDLTVSNERYTGKVIGGSSAHPAMWRYQASLQYDNWNSGSFAHICGGSLVSPLYVMTAAHCILDMQVRNYRVVLGDYNLYKYEGTEQSRSVTKIVVHPGWTGDLTIGNDIALLRLASPVYSNGNIALAELPYPEQTLPNGFTCYITGWGLLATGGSTPDILQEAPIPVVEHSVCASPDWWSTAVRKTMVCAGGDGKTSGCQGDSGGPLSCFTDGYWRVHGVVSFGPAADCNTYRKPTVFTRVSSFMNWLYSEMV